ncbi:hypothetical protein SAMN05444580_104338 [Rhodococcus tukisamuensis]|uniref:Uncharacterized protein n=1 Tax=Rhodococcus tukisamuensis TaxID=168276 RepID=A0A1G6UYB2_9NOCA|nr:hypothetical protein SAMN05444580_104338 [Rhodococcus tukisamuensis]
MQVGLVESRPGIGPKGGGTYTGVPLAVGPKHTRLLRPYDGVKTPPDTDLPHWNSPFVRAPR